LSRESSLTNVTARGSVNRTVDAPKDRWLARLSYSFLIVAFVLAWSAVGLPHDAPGSTWRRTLYLVGASVSAAMGLLGVRARHRRG
jgi:hypothetical protein